MNTQNITSVIGVSIENNRYVLCEMDNSGKNCHYYSGRIDTQGGQEKFLSKLSGDTIVLIPDCLLAIRAYELFPDNVSIFPQSILWDSWVKAGVSKGEPLSRFTAEFLLSEKLPDMELSEQQKTQILLDGQMELEKIKRIGESSQYIMEQVLEGNPDPALCKQALQNEYESGKPVYDQTEVEEKTDLPKDDSFFSRFSQVLKDTY
jgi:hypothetical protein